MGMIDAKVDRRTVLAGLAAAPWAGTAAAREVERDVPYVPTPQPVVDAMLKLGEAAPDDYHIDLGCGDGRIVVTAARDFGTRGLGVDIDVKRIAEAKFRAEREGVQDRVEFRRGDLFQTDISGATLLTLYLLPAINMRLRPTILARLKPGTRVVSHDFDMGDWPPDRTVRIKEENSTLYLWRVPANVAGLWRVTAANGAAHDVRIEQRFQRLTGEAFREGRVEGAAVRFAFADGRTYTGRAEGDTITGDGWQAARFGD